MRIVVLVGSLAVVAISLLAILSGSDDTSDPPVPPPPETADSLPKLPPGWTSSENDAIGVDLGVPPRWSSKPAASKTTLRSPGSAVVLSVTADRSADAINADLDAYALEIASGLDRGEAEGADPPSPGLGYEAAAATAGRTDVIVVRRTELAAYPMLVARNPKVKPAELDPLVDGIVASLRGRPVASK